MYRLSREKRLLSILLAVAMFFSMSIFTGMFKVSAKTLESAKCDNFFFYAMNSAGKSVLLKVIPYADLQKLEHGQANGEDYYYSSSDNYPTTQFCEARGFTFSELINYVKSVSSVEGTSSLSFSSGDTMKFMATDSFGNYSRSWTYDKLYGVDRYYFEGLYDETSGWKEGWEVENEGPAVALDTYMSKYQAGDVYYNDKKAVFDTGVKMDVILATSSDSGRTTSQPLVASTEKGLAAQIAANGGIVAGSLKSTLSGNTALRLCIPTSEADLMAAHRAAYDNFKWIYNMQLDMGIDPSALKSSGTVSEAVASVTKSSDGKTATITLTCPTEGASIYYSFDGSPQILYTGPVNVDISGRDLASNPIAFYSMSVKEGYDDAGVVSYKYPGLSPTFESQYSSQLGNDVVFTAAKGVNSSDFNDWANAMTSITMKTPTTDGYVKIDAGKYNVDKTAMKVTFDKSLVTETGSYSFIFHATGYADKSVSVIMKQQGTLIEVPSSWQIGTDGVFSFSDTAYQNNLNIYITPPGGSQTLIPVSVLDKSVPGKLTIKASYFDSPSCAIKNAGTYKITFSNNDYNPVTQDETVVVTGGNGTPADPSNPDNGGTTGVSGFSDVSSSAWYADAVSYVNTSGYFSGTGDGKFSPDTAMTRAMFVTVLSRMAGIDSGNQSNSGFTDVPNGMWYTGPVKWASQQSIVAGVGDGLFDPDGTITREQMAQLLYGYAKFSGKDISSANRSKYSAIAGSSSTSAWAEDAMIWATYTGLISGTDIGLEPQGKATRAQVAQIIKNYCNIIV